MPRYGKLSTIHPDPELTELSRMVSATERNLMLLQLDLTSNHPEGIKQKSLLEKVTQQLDSKIDGMLVGIATRVESAKERLQIITQHFEGLQTGINELQQQNQAPGPLKPQDAELSNPAGRNPPSPQQE
jgi:uncharacterized protein involved in exopolysaccharide biosynthesis